MRCGGRPPCYTQARKQSGIITEKGSHENRWQHKARTQTHQTHQYTPQPHLSTHYAASGLLTPPVVGCETLVGSKIMVINSNV